MFSAETNRGVLINNFQALAIHLNKFDWYENLYKEFSKATHGGGLTIMNLSRLPDGSVSLLGLRHLYQAHHVVNLTLRMSELAFDLLKNSNPDLEQRGKITWWSKAFDINHANVVIKRKIEINEDE